MKRSVLEIYAFAVCFVTMICFAVALGLGIYGAIGIVSPAFTLSSWEFERHRTNDDFWRIGGMREGPIPPGQATKEVERPSEEKLSRERLESYSFVLLAERRNSMQTLTKAAIVMMINIVVFLLHWRLARQAKSHDTPV